MTISHQTTQKIKYLVTGDRTPDFILYTNEGTTLQFSSLQGSYAVLYFYSQDNMAVCVKELQNFTKLMTHFDTIDTFVIGVSRDSVFINQTFIKEHNLEVALLSDPGGNVCSAYNVLKKEKESNKKPKSIETSTFLVDRMGHLVHIWRNVRVNGHAEEVLEAAREMYSQYNFRQQSNLGPSNPI